MKGRALVSWCVWLSVLIPAGSGPAAAWDHAGGAWLLVNDAFADRHDRWRTHSLQAGWLYARAPGGPGPDLVELRFSTQLITPANLAIPAPDDRPLVGVHAVGLHGYWLAGDMALQLGAELAGTGPWTGYADLLDAIHPTRQEPVDSVIDGQIDDALVPSVHLGASRGVAMAPGVWLHPFAEARAGTETLARLGADLLIGAGGAGALPVRDKVTGFLIPATAAAATGAAFMVGLDGAFVAASRYLPERDGLEIENPRLRARAGAFWRGARTQLFYGVTWLGKEFTAQPEAQIVGAIQFGFRF